MRLLMVTQEPNRNHRDKRARQEVTCHHRKTDRQRQRNEQCAGRAFHEERRYEHSQHTQHGQQAGDGCFPIPQTNGAGDARRVLELRVNVLHFDGRLIDQNADRQGQPAQRHHVERLARQPKRDDASQQGKRDVEHDDDHAPPVTQEEEHHQPGERGSEKPLGADAPDCP